MEVTGEVARVTHRKSHGLAYLTVVLAREGTHPIRLKYLHGFEAEPRVGQIVTISGVPLVLRTTNISVTSVEIIRDAPEVRITRERLVNAQPGRRDPGFIHYCTGPDGTRFDNRSIVTLRDVLRRKYGRGVRITETWKTA